MVQQSMDENGGGRHATLPCAFQAVVCVSKKLVGSYNTSIIKELPLFSLFFFKPGMAHSWILFWGFLGFDVMCLVSFCLSSSITLISVKFA